MFTKDRGSVPGTIIVFIMFAVVLMGVIMIISDYESSRAAYLSTPGAIDPTGGVLNGTGYNRTSAVTTTLVDIGANLIWFFVLAAFVVLLFGVVYFYTKR